MPEIISKIKSKYILQMIFAHLNYKTVLNITRYNKNIQNKLGLNIGLFQEWSSYQYGEKTTIFDKREMRGYMMTNEGYIKCCCSGLCSMVVFIYILIFASILAAKGAFDENNTKNNYNKNYSKIVDKINYSLFGFLGYMIISYILIFIWATFDCYTDYGIMKIIKKIVMIFLFIIYLLYEVLIIIKLYFSYQIKKKVTWFMICDYILIILIFLYIIFLVIPLFSYFRNAGKAVEIRKKVALTKFRGIKISEYELPDNFHKMNKKDKKKFILKKKNNYKITVSESNKDLIFLINEFRKENNIDELIYDEDIFYKDLIIDKYSEPILSTNENVFKLSDTNYLFKFPVGEFEKNFRKRKININNILLKDNLEKIIIIKKNNFEFINLFKPQKERRLSDIDIHIRFPSEIFRLESLRYHEIYSKYKYFDD